LGSRIRATERIPSLDGLRAISVVIILSFHLRLLPSVDRPHWMRFDVATLGMFIFFVISGFIITELLLDERERAGTIHLPSFYGRRFFRIFPALLGYLLGLAVLGGLGLASCSVHQLWLGLTFLGNYRYSGCLSTGHLWSLSVEEQFYLLWPIVLSRLSSRNASRLLLIVICTVPVIRIVHVVHGADWMTLEWHSESVADSLAIGCLLAIGRTRLHANRTYQWFANSSFCWFLPAGILAAGWQHSALFYQGVGKTLMLLGIAIGIDISIQRSKTAWGRCLNSAVLVRLGLWSYSIYLWQQVFTLQLPGAQPYAQFPLNLALSISVGITSYYLIERPALLWGRQMIPRAQRSADVAVAKEAG
jgi:peptidoglycan/LPS O-acetylase OafA/YrhL